jgi:pantoate--beta-alanine ligase
MGALHRGHLSLIQRSCKENEHTVVSIFVNPTQFNDKSDLERYPRTLDADVALLEQTPCDVVFAPSVEEIYPVPDTRIFDFGNLDKVMEGAHRPGHFNGVAQVVSRLFDLLPATRAYFGEKDFQQLVIMRNMVRQLNLPIELVACPIVREPDGLALSSRNALLTPAQRKSATSISRTLFGVVDRVCEHEVEQIREFVADAFDREPLLQLEYFEIVNADTLQPVASIDDDCPKVACIAVRAGNIRLIDNMRI